jgi:hypothetical protein
VKPALVCCERLDARAIGIGVEQYAPISFATRCIHDQSGAGTKAGSPAVINQRVRSARSVPKFRPGKTSNGHFNCRLRITRKDSQQMAVRARTSPAGASSRQPASKCTDDGRRAGYPFGPTRPATSPGPVFGRRNWHASRADEARRSLNASSQDALWVPGDGRGIDRIDASSGVGEQHCGSGGENSPRDGPDSAYMRDQTVECARDQ